MHEICYIYSFCYVMFQIRKCGDELCCGDREYEAEWLPDPMLAEGKENYKPYEDIRGTDTFDTRPALSCGTRNVTEEEQVITE